jgi:hypothetical protein
MHADDEWLDLESLDLYDRILRRLVGLVKRGSEEA